jgi:riboflavin biosynthesis pyrimidine reductase
MDRPYIICLMMMSVDGKILSQKWGNNPKIKNLLKHFEQAHENLGVPAWLCGRRTMEKDFTKGAKPLIKQGNQQVERKDFVGDRDATSYAIAIDADGKLGWEKSSLHGDHVITILTEQVADGYLAQLQEIGVSYIFAGKQKLDLHMALQKIHDIFHIEKLMLEGGGGINGSFLNEELIDELHLLILPIADGTKETTSVFEISEDLKKEGATLMKLEAVKQIEDDVLWLTYKIQRG